MSVFNFKHFKINQTNATLKIGTDAFLLGAITDYSKAHSILDIGTGTGVLALIAAQSNLKANITALEIDALNSLLAMENFKNSEWSSRLEIKKCDFLEYEPINKFDLIISNPPYFENSTKTNTRRKDLAKHNNSLTPDKLFKKVSTFLTETGTFWCILPFDHSQDYLTKAKENNLVICAKIDIYGKPNVLRRFVYCFSKQPEPLSKKSIIVRDKNGKYTKEYKELTKELHDREL